MVLLADNASGLIWPPVVATGEEAAATWPRLFARAEQAGLVLRQVQGVTSDGATGLLAYLAFSLDWVTHQRSVFHLWRPRYQEILLHANHATRALIGEAATGARRAVWRESVPLVRAILNAPSHLDLSPLAVAGIPTHRISYLDALSVRSLGGSARLPVAQPSRTQEEDRPLLDRAPTPANLCLHKTERVTSPDSSSSGLMETLTWR